ncbi:MAG: diguanylate cyclase [Proteobacteria bacterium]|nr:diguanylate cyclase [Pseudomonadota bacterium]
MKEKKTISKKLFFRLSVIFLILICLIITIAFFSLRKLAIDTSKENALSMAKTIRDGLTSLMVLGVIDKRDVFLAGLSETDVLSGAIDIKIIRGDPVIAQFGPPKENEKAETEIELNALRTGKIQEQFNEFVKPPFYRVVVPYKAESKGRIKCVNCHSVEDGEVLGAVSITMNLIKQRDFGLNALALLSITVLMLSLFAFYILFRFFRPYTNFFEALKDGFEEMGNGRFNSNITLQLYDEIAVVASTYNKMLKILSETFTGIRNKVFVLSGYKSTKSGNAITDTIDNVDQLIEIYHFKQIIEQDNSKGEIYARIKSALVKLGLDKFYIYEVEYKNESFTLIEDLKPDQGLEDSFGDQKVTKAKTTEYSSLGVNPCCIGMMDSHEECRAIRTGTAFNSNGNPGICPIFKGDERKKILHYCIPNLGTTIATVIQIIYSADETEEIASLVPFVKTYQREAFSNLEVKTVFSMIKEQALVDELTGFYNRRYLENISAKFTNLNKRNERVMGFIMIDIDHFKNVNDSYGHDVGDIVIKELTSVITNTIRQADIAVRYGGEEFLILATEVRPRKTKLLAEKIRIAVENYPIDCGSVILNKTISLGCSELPVDATDFWECIKLADSALYTSKGEGRNRAIQYSPDDKDPHSK